MTSRGETLDYLSPAWLAAAGEAVGQIPPVDGDVVIGFEVGEPGRSYQLVLGPDRVTYREPDGPAGLTIRIGYATAVSIATGRTSAQRALLDGEIVLNGDANLLLGHGALLTGIDDRLAELRSRTRF